jgi:Uma2 family endonuclease
MNDVSAESFRHNRAKVSAYRALNNAVKTAGLPYQAFITGVAVDIGDDPVSFPDVVVQKGPVSDWEKSVAEDPLIVVEVSSPGMGVSASDYIGCLSVPTIHHYLISVLKKRAVIHHQRSGHGTFDTRIMKDGDIVLDPPGLSVSVAAFLGEED